MDTTTQETKRSTNYVMTDTVSTNNNSENPGSEELSTNTVESGADTTGGGEDTVETGAETTNSGEDTVETAADTTESGHDTMDGGNDTTESGHDTMDGGHDTTESGHDTMDGGHNTIESGHDTMDGGHDTTESGHDTMDGGNDTIESGHDTMDGGHDHHDDSQPTHTDPEKMADHMAMLELVSHENATHIAINDGSWFDADTWLNGEIPSDGAHVLIGKDVHVMYDQQSDARIQTIRADGDISFSTTENTKLIVDTFVVNANGSLTIGTEDNPVQAGVNTQILIADNGQIDLNWDPTMVSRGIITHGDVSMHGQEKLVHTKVSIDAMAGDNMLTLAETPTNWNIGDVLVLSATEYDRNASDTQDEVVTIASIEGNVVTLNEALEYDHATPRDDLFASVANYTRNIEIASENPDVPINERGHVMFMHNDNIDVQYVAFNGLGRTDKSRNITDYEVHETAHGDQILNRVENADGSHTMKNALEWTEAGMEYDELNIRGRYGVHLHKTGVDGESGAYLEGNALMGSPGWGYVQHDSVADFNNNAAYDVYGAGFASETGNEIGTWSRNISIKNMGRDTKVKEGFGNHDTGGEGYGFWLQSRLVAVNDNIAVSASEDGFAWFSMGADLIDAPSEFMLNPAAAQAEFIDTEMQNMFSNARNETFASNEGMLSIRNKSFQGHDDRNIIEDFTAWNVDYGIEISYTSKYAIHGLDVLGNGLNDGVLLGGFAEDVTLVDAKIDGFTNGVNYTKFSNSLPFGEEDQFYFTVVNPTFGESITTQIKNFNPETDKILQTEDLSDAPLNLQLDDDTLVAKWLFSGGYIGFSPLGTKTDSLGQVKFPAGSESFSYDFAETARHIIDNGYWTLKDGTEVTVFETLISDRASGIAKTFKFMVTLEEGYVNFAKALNGKVNDFYQGEFTLTQDIYVAANVDRANIPHIAEHGEAFYLAGKHLSEMLQGTNYDDVILGNGGDDVILGGGGNDVVTGGDGADSYIVSPDAPAIMTITDFDVTQDVIDASEYNSVEFIQYLHHLVVKLADEQQIVLPHMTYDMLNEANISGVTMPAQATILDEEYVYHLVDSVPSAEAETPATPENAPDTSEDTISSGAETPENDVPEQNDDTVSGYNIIEGTARKELLNGTNDNDIINAHDGFDKVFGGGGDDIINGGAGFDKLWGSAGADTFVFTPNEDTVGDMLRDFNAFDGDKIDISALLQGYDADTSVLSDFVRIDKHAGHAFVHVNADGEGDDFVEIAFVVDSADLADYEEFTFLIL